MNFDLEQLQTMLAVVDAGGFDDASIDLGITPSAVSQRIKALESKAGAVLLVRSRPVRPTDQGARILTYARQISLLGQEVTRQLSATAHEAGRYSLVVGINADSLATWFSTVLLALGQREDISCEVLRGDENRNLELLKNGRVSGVITTSSEAAQGCSVWRLGSMRYWAVATAEFIEKHSTGDTGSQWLKAAPVVLFDREDPLQLRMRKRVTGARDWADTPLHYIPDSHQYVNAVEAGMGWGMVPEIQLKNRARLKILDEAWWIDVPLFWQRWAVKSQGLDILGGIIKNAAKEAGL